MSVTISYQAVPIDWPVLRRANETADVYENLKWLEVRFRPEYRPTDNHFTNDVAFSREVALLVEAHPGIDQRIYWLAYWDDLHYALSEEGRTGAYARMALKRTYLSTDWATTAIMGQQPFAKWELKQGDPPLRWPYASNAAVGRWRMLCPRR